jgi:hypothetical protein
LRTPLALKGNAVSHHRFENRDTWEGRMNEDTRKLFVEPTLVEEGSLADVTLVSNTTDSDSTLPV